MVKNRYQIYTLTKSRQITMIKIVTPYTHNRPVKKANRLFGKYNLILPEQH